jgi:hypothetical protein
LTESWGCSGASETTFASLMRTAGVEPRRIYAGWQLKKLQCCRWIRAELLSLSKATPPHSSSRSIGVILSRPSPALTHHRRLAPSEIAPSPTPVGGMRH